MVSSAKAHLRSFTDGCGPVLDRADLRTAFEEAERRMASTSAYSTSPDSARVHRAYWQTHRERFYRTAKLFLQHTEHWPLRVLDVGSHYLQFACLLQCLGLEVFGCDVQEFASDAVLQQRASELGVQNVAVEPLAKIRRLPYDGGQFDVVFLLETIEHWNANPSVLLAELYRVIAPDGRLVVTTPNFYGYHTVSRRIARFASGHGGYVSVQELLQEGNLFHHWKEYSRKELSELLGRFGFHVRVVESLTGIGDGTPAWVARLCRPWGQFLYAEYRR